MSGRRSWSQFKQDREDSATWQRLLKVVRRMSTFDLLEHMDMAGSGMAKAVQDYRKDSDIVSLLEIRRGLTELEAVTEELMFKHEAATDEH